jgi:hypothetical protein
MKLFHGIGVNIKPKTQELTYLTAAEATENVERVKEAAEPTFLT